MANTKKRPSKAAKAAKKLLADSKLLAAAKAASTESGNDEFKSSVVTPRANSTPMKARPDKKRG